MTTADTITAAITSLQQEIATQEASSPLYAQRDSLMSQLNSVLIQINALEAQTDIRTARVTLAKLQSLQATNAVAAAQGV